MTLYHEYWYRIIDNKMNPLSSSEMDVLYSNKNDYIEIYMCVYIFNLPTLYTYYLHIYLGI